MGRWNDGVSPPASIVSSSSSDGRKYDSRYPQTSARMTTVVAMRPHRSSRARLVGSDIVVAADVPGDARHVEEHARRVAGQADGRVGVVHEAKGLAADGVAQRAG